MNFSKRYREDELMDDLGLPSGDLQRTYDDIETANRLLGGDKVMIKALSNLISENPKPSYSILDVGCGNGALLRKIADFFRAGNLDYRLTGIDLNPTAIDLAKASSLAYPEISFATVDVLQKKASDLRADIVLSTLTMHHIPEDKINVFLKRLVEMAGIGIIINDLQRSRSAYYLFKLFSTIFIRTNIAKNDGLVSIRSGFTKKELLQYSKRLPNVVHKIRPKWAFRYVWVMRVKRPTTHE